MRSCRGRLIPLAMNLCFELLHGAPPSEVAHLHLFSQPQNLSCPLLPFHFQPLIALGNHFDHLLLMMSFGTHHCLLELLNSASASTVPIFHLPFERPSLTIKHRPTCRQFTFQHLCVLKSLSASRLDGAQIHCNGRDTLPHIVFFSAAARCCIESACARE